MRLTLYAVGNKMPAWVSEGFNEYCRRFPRDMSFDLIEIPPGKRGKNADIARILEKEGELTLAAIPKGNRIVTLEVEGKPWTLSVFGETINKHANCRIAATANTTGGGDSDRYITSQRLDQALRSRFGWLKTKYPSKAVDRGKINKTNKNQLII